MNLIFSIIIGALAGFIAEKVLKTSMGLFMNLILGIIGGFVGGWIFSILKIGSDSDSFLFSLITASIGAILVLFLFNKLKSK